MSYSVANGAVGNSPLIDKLNHFPVEQISTKVGKQIESHILDHKNSTLHMDQFSFHSCKEELKNHLKRR